jgi:rhamnosyltransferase
MKIAATVILYNPSEIVLNNIGSYIESVEKLYVVDNSEVISTSMIESNVHSDKVVYIHDGENKGIAARLNQVCDRAKQDQYQWLLTMDQDSSFSEGMLNDYLNCLNAFEGAQVVSMFGVNYTDDRLVEEKCHPTDVNHLITSGSILNLKLWSTIGKFDEDLFIDEVDYEYCLRSVLQGFRIIEFSNIFLDHSLGQVSQHLSFKTIERTSRVLHSPERLYYITRNFLYVQSRFHNSFPEEIKKRKKVFLNRIKNNLLYNKARVEVLKFIIKGAVDYRKRRMGRMR